MHVLTLRAYSDSTFPFQKLGATLKEISHLVMQEAEAAVSRIQFKNNARTKEMQ